MIDRLQRAVRRAGWGTDFGVHRGRPRHAQRAPRLSLASLIAVIVACLLMGSFGSAAWAEVPQPPNPPGGNAPMAAAAGGKAAAADISEEYFGPPPADCPAGADRQLCLDSVALAPSYEAERAIKWAFARIGAPYDKNKRDTTGFDCSSFVGRAMRAGGAKVAARNGKFYDFFPYFGWTGAYMPTGAISMWGGGYDGTNVKRITKEELRPGDLIIQFIGNDPANSQGNDGHAQIYLGGSRVIEAGGSSRDHVGVGPTRMGYFTNEWYFRYQSLGQEKPGYSTALAGGRSYSLQVGTPGDAVIGNLTIVSPLSKGNAVVYNCDTGRPTASSIQFAAGRTTATLAVAQLDATGRLCIYSSATAHVLWDQGWSGTSMATHPPIRLLDTRAFGRPVVRGGVVEVDTGAPGKTVMATLSVVDPVAGGHTRVFPCDADNDQQQDALPNASLNNFDPGMRSANLAVVRADDAGKVCIYTSAPTHLLWDQVVETSDPLATVPVRLFDSRLLAGSDIANNDGQRLDPKDPAKVVRIQTSGPYTTIMGNLTIINPGSQGHAEVYPCTEGKNGTSAVNFAAGQKVANSVLARSDWNGQVCIWVTDWAHVLWDQSVDGSQALYASAASRLIDSRVPLLRPQPVA